MSYSYDRTPKTAETPKIAKTLPAWGSVVFEWMENLANAVTKELHATLGGDMTGAKSLSGQYGVYASIDDAGFSGDLTGTVQVSVWWIQGVVNFRVWAHHPQRGSIDLIKSDLDFRDRPDDIINRALAGLRQL